MDRDPTGRLILVDDTDVLNSYCIIPNSEDVAEQELLDIVSGDVHEFPLVLSSVHSEILSYRAQEILDDPMELPSIKDAARALLASTRKVDDVDAQ